MLHFLSPTATPTPQVRALERVSESWVPHASWGEELRPQRGPESPPVPGGRSSRSSAPLPWARRAGPASGSGPDVPEAEMVGRGPRRANLTDPAAAFTGQGCPSEKNEDDGWTPGLAGKAPAEVRERRRAQPCGKGRLGLASGCADLEPLCSSSPHHASLQTSVRHRPGQLATQQGQRPGAGVVVRERAPGMDREEGRAPLGWAGACADQALRR